MRRPRRTVIALSALALPICLGAQTAPQSEPRPAPLAPGTAVRVTTTRGERLYGTLMDPHPDTLVVATGDAGVPFARMIALADLAQVETVQGTRTAKLRGGLVGLVIGGGLGALIGYAGADHESQCKPPQQSICFDFHEIDEAASAALGAIIGGAGGGAIGLYVGSQPHADWRPANVQPYLQRVGNASNAAGGPRRVGLRGSIAF